MLPPEVKSLVKLPLESQLGPAMRALTERQKNFVVAMLETGEYKLGKLARMAGYQGDDNTMRVRGHELAHNEKVLAAIKEESTRRIQSASLIATSKLVEIAADNGRKDQIKAIEMILNRTGFHAITESRSLNLTVVSDDSKIKRIQEFCKFLGLDATKLLGTAGVKVVDAAGQAIDAEFSEVVKVAEPGATASPVKNVPDKTGEDECMDGLDDI